MPADTLRNFLCVVLKHELIPYLWGADIRFDLGIRSLRNRDITGAIAYEWECVTDDESMIVSKGIGVFPFFHASPLTEVFKASPTGVIRTWQKYGFRQLEAINIGCISTTAHYKLRMTFTDEEGQVSEQMIMAEFSIKDRDDIYLRILQIGVSAVVAGVSGFVGYLIGAS
jgi:hypothetical protein